VRQKAVYYVYILTNKSNTLYTGVTKSLERRVIEHALKQSKFTSKYNIDRLIYYCDFSDINDAIAAEKKIKGWRRSKKIELIKSINPHFNNLFVT
jgi:putative endonuclease